MRDYSEILKKVSLFDSIKTDEINSIVTNLGARVKKYDKDEYIRHIGDPSDFVGIVLSGSIQIVQDDYYGNRSITATFGEGEIFGEAFACAGVKVLPVGILSCEESKIMFISKTTLLNACNGDCRCGCSRNSHHTIISNLLKSVASKNILLNRKLQYSSHKTTSEKIMAYLNDQARINESDSFTIPFNRQELADYLGVERSAMSVEINKLVRAGVIETKRSYFRLIREGVSSKDCLC